jgi:hypothetical protein
MEVAVAMERFRTTAGERGMVLGELLEPPPHRMWFPARGSWPVIPERLAPDDPEADVR